jgi:hypothetical protein
VFKELLNLLRPGFGTPTDERRDTIRLGCRIPVLAKVKTAMVEVKVVNASLTGLCLEMEKPIKPKTRLVLHKDELGDPVEAKVVWCRGLRGSARYQAGVTYVSDRDALKSSWIKPALKQLGFTVGRIGEKRKLLRVPGRYRCFLKSMAGDTYASGELTNLSIGGCLVESEVELPLKLKLRIKTDPVGGLEALTGTAEVRSCKKNPQTRNYCCGLRFVDIDELLVKRHMAIMMSHL